MAKNSKVGGNGSKAILPPIGVFWDIENCQVPKGKSAIALVQSIRDGFFNGYREAEFVCVCDASKENSEVIRDLNDAQVTVVHVIATAKNAADDKLCQLMRRFSGIHGPKSAVVLISGDVNFATELFDLRYRAGHKVIIIHNGFASEALLACAHRHVSFHDIAAKIPFKSLTKSCLSQSSFEVIVTNLPQDQDELKIRTRLKQLSENCGGRVICINGDQAVLRFASKEITNRAKQRMDREDVFGNKISVNFPNSNGEIGVSDSHEETSIPLDRKKGKQSENEYRSSPDRNSTFHPTPKSSRDSYFASKGGKKTPFPPPPPVPFVDPAFQSWNSTNPSSSVLHPFYSGGILSLDGDSNLGTSTSFSSKCDDIWRSSYDQTQLMSLMSKKVLPRSSTSNGDRENGHFGRREMTPDGARNFYEQREQQDGSVHVMFPGYTQSQCWNSDVHQLLPQQQQYFSNGRQSGRSSASRHSTPSPRIPFNAGGSGHLDTSRSVNCTSLPLSTSPHALQTPSTCESRTSYDGSDVVSSSKPVELQISNLDQSIDAKDMKKYLQSIFREHVMVLHVSVSLSPDGNLTAGIRVPSLQDAQYAISQLHRRRIGSKRILIHLTNYNSNCPPLNVLRSHVLGLMMDVPGKILPLFKFREVFERRYGRSIGTSELHRVQDVVSIQDHADGRMVVLNKDYRNTPSPASSEGSREVQEILEMSRCEIHCHNENEGKGWAEKEQASQLPNVIISIRKLAGHIHSLLQSHDNSIPLISLPTCYEYVFGKLNIVAESGVPLEHLVTCVPGVQIVKSASGVKRLEWIENKNVNQAELRVSPPLVSQLVLFSREIVDLLKNEPFCRIAFTKFIPAYHHHFGRQCRVADYGYTKLLDLLEALDHVVQMLGDGNRRMLTLTHRAQVKRFTADLLRLLKSQACKRILLTEFPDAYNKCFGKPFDIFNYGVCHIMDVLPEISDGTIVVSENGSETVISIPQREQTVLEMERTKQFSSEVIELLRHNPHCKMNFTKFIPAYHHHFGKQCRVADYGFSKLIELFETIPNVVNIKICEEDPEEKVLQLCEPLMLQVLADQMSHILTGAGRQFVSLEKVLVTFMQLYGYSLCPEDFGTDDVIELLNKMDNVVKVVNGPNGLAVTPADFGHVPQLSRRVLEILCPFSNGQIPLSKFCDKYKEKYGVKCEIGQLRFDLKHMVQITGPESSKMIRLVPLQILTRDIVMLLNEMGRLPLPEFETAYASKFGRQLVPGEYGYQTLSALLEGLPKVVQVKYRGSKKCLVLKKELANPYLTEKLDRNGVMANGKRKLPVNKQIDLLGDLDPCRLPSPNLQPLPVNASSFHLNGDRELIQFDSPTKELEARGPDGDVTVHYNTDTSHEKMFLVLQPSARPTSPFFPPPSLVPPVPVTWMYQALAPPMQTTPLMSSSTSAVMESSPPQMDRFRHNCNGGRTPGTPVMAENDSSENEMSTPPCVREVIAPSSAESTPTHNVVGRERQTQQQQRTPRIAAAFSNLPLTQSPKSNGIH